LNGILLLQSQFRFLPHNWFKENHSVTWLAQFPMSAVRVGGAVSSALHEIGVAAQDFVDLCDFRFFKLCFGQRPNVPGALIGGRVAVLVAPNQPARVPPQQFLTGELFSRSAAPFG
jgi:hypothetical protein